MRTIITIPEQDKKWLDRYSRSKKVSRAQIIREALQEYKKRRSKDSFQATLEKVYGLWNGRNGDALDYVNKLREDRSYE